MTRIDTAISYDGLDDVFEIAVSFCHVARWQYSTVAVPAFSFDFQSCLLSNKAAVSAKSMLWHWFYKTNSDSGLWYSPEKILPKLFIAMG